MSALTEHEASAIGVRYRVHCVRDVAVSVILASVFALDIATPVSVLAAMLYVLVLFDLQFGSITTQPKIIAAICAPLARFGRMFASSQDIPQWTDTFVIAETGHPR